MTAVAFISRAMKHFPAKISIFLILELLLNWANGIYDPLHPPVHENFDPVEANPDGFVECVGGLQIELPIFDDFNPNGHTLQELCVKPQYRGGQAGRHAGAFCVDRLSSLVAFDNSTGARVHTALANPRMWLQCAFRCFCRGVNWQAATFPEEHQLVRPAPTTADYLIKADLVDDFVLPPNENPGVNYHNAPSVDTQVLKEVAVRHLQLRRPWGYASRPPTENLLRYSKPPVHYEVQTSLDPINSVISCDGPLPGFSILPPFTHFDYVHFANPLRALCATSIDGGAE